MPTGAAKRDEAGLGARQMHELWRSGGKVRVIVSGDAGAVEALDARATEVSAGGSGTERNSPARLERGRPRGSAWTLNTNGRTKTADGKLAAAFDRPDKAERTNAPADQQEQLARSISLAAGNHSTVVVS
jgi:hypothetical protein